MIEAALSVEVAPAVIEKGTPERQQFEEDFTWGVSQILGVAQERVKVVDIMSVNATAGAERRRLQAAVSVEVRFVVLPDPETGSNEGEFGSVASTLVRELSEAGVAICPADCASCDASTGHDPSTCCQVSSPADSCERSYSAVSGITQSEDQVADMVALLQAEPTTVTVRITLSPLDISPQHLDAEAFASDVAALLSVSVLRVLVVSTTPDPSDRQQTVVEFIVLADPDTGQALALTSLEDALGGWPTGPILAGYESSDLDYEGRPASILPVLIGIVAATVVVAAFAIYCYRSGSDKVVPEKYAVGGRSFVPDAKDFDVESDDGADTEPPPLVLQPVPHRPPMARLPENPLDLPPLVHRPEAVRNHQAEHVARSHGMLGP